MPRTFLLKVVSEFDRELYANHSVAYKGDAGLDLFAIKDQTIQPGETVLVNTGVICQNVSRSFWGTKYNSYLLMPRSSIYKTPLMMKNSVGLIDSNYLNNIMIPLFNTSCEPFTIKRGDRYAQLVNGNLSNINISIVDHHNRKTQRGLLGFGSSGR